MHSEEHAVAAECLVRSLFHLHDKLTKKKGKQKVPFRNTQTFSLYLGKYAILMRLPDFEKILSFGNKDLAKRVTSMTRSVRWICKAQVYCYCYDIVTAPFALLLTVYSLHFRQWQEDFCSVQHCVAKLLPVFFTLPMRTFWNERTLTTILLIVKAAFQCIRKSMQLRLNAWCVLYSICMANWQRRRVNRKFRWETPKLFHCILANMQFWCGCQILRKFSVSVTKI